MKPIDSYGNQPSDEAWLNFHRKLAELNLKHGHMLIQDMELINKQKGRSVHMD